MPSDPVELLGERVVEILSRTPHTHDGAWQPASVSVVRSDQSMIHLRWCIVSELSCAYYIVFCFFVRIFDFLKKFDSLSKSL